MTPDFDSGAYERSVPSPHAATIAGPDSTTDQYGADAVSIGLSEPHESPCHSIVNSFAWSMSSNDEMMNRPLTYQTPRAASFATPPSPYTFVNVLSIERLAYTLPF